MNIVWGIIVIIISLIGWLGQTIAALSSTTAAKLGVAEPEADVDPTFHADGVGEAFWDMVTLWILPVAGILLIMNNPLWVYFGLVGGGMYLYFAGRGIVVRWVMQRRGIRIGKPETLKVAYVFLTLWGLTAIVTIIMAVVALSLP